MKYLASFALILSASSAMAAGHCQIPRTGQTVSVKQFFLIAQQTAQSSGRCVTAATSFAAIGAYQFDEQGNVLDSQTRRAGCSTILCNMVD